MYIESLQQRMSQEKKGDESGRTKIIASQFSQGWHACLLLDQLVFGTITVSDEVLQADHREIGRASCRERV